MGLYFLSSYFRAGENGASDALRPMFMVGRRTCSCSVLGLRGLHPSNQQFSPTRQREVLRFSFPWGMTEVQSFPMPQIQKTAELGASRSSMCKAPSRHYTEYQP